MNKKTGMITRILVVLLVSFGLLSAEFMRPLYSVRAVPESELVQIPVSNSVSNSRLSDIYNIIKAGFDGNDRTATIEAIKSLGEICQSYRVPQQLKELTAKVYYLYIDQESLPRKELKSITIEDMAEELFGQDAKQTILTDFEPGDVMDEFSAFLQQGQLVSYKSIFSGLSDGQNNSTYQDKVNARSVYFSTFSIEERAELIQAKQTRLTEIELDMVHRGCDRYNLSGQSSCSLCDSGKDADECRKCHEDDANFGTCYDLSKERTEVLADVYSLQSSLNLKSACLTDGGSLHKCLLDARIIPAPSDWTPTPLPTGNPLVKNTPTHTTNIIYPDLIDGSGISPTGTPIPWVYITPDSDKK